MNFYYSHEDQLRDITSQKIDAFWQKQVFCSHFTGFNNIAIHYAQVIHPNSQGTLVISNGRVESLLKYQELIYELYQNGWSVFAIDHRGQGLSDRMHADTERGWVDDFHDYTVDFAYFMQHIVLPNSQHTPHLLCHSMGSAIGALYLLQYPQQFHKVIFNAPMFGIQTPLPSWLASTLLRTGLKLNALLSKTPWYFLGQSGYIDVPFALNHLTHSQIRYQRFRELFRRNSSLQLGGVTYQWLHAATQAMEQIANNAHKISQEVLLVQAERDSIVDNAAQDHVFTAMPNAQKYIAKDARHEVLIEQDAIRKPALETILRFLSNA